MRRYRVVSALCAFVVHAFASPLHADAAPDADARLARCGKAINDYAAVQRSATKTNPYLFKDHPDFVAEIRSALVACDALADATPTNYERTLSAAFLNIRFGFDLPDQTLLNRGSRYLNETTDGAYAAKNYELFLRACTTEQRFDRSPTDQHCDPALVDVANAATIPQLNGKLSPQAAALTPKSAQALETACWSVGREWIERFKSNSPSATRLTLDPPFEDRVVRATTDCQDVAFAFPDVPIYLIHAAVFQLILGGVHPRDAEEWKTHRNAMAFLKRGAILAIRAQDWFTIDYACGVAGDFAARPEEYRCPPADVARAEAAIEDMKASIRSTASSDDREEAEERTAIEAASSRAAQESQESEDRAHRGY